MLEQIAQLIAQILRLIRNVALLKGGHEWKSEEILDLLMQAAEVLVAGMRAANEGEWERLQAAKQDLIQRLEEILEKLRES